MVAAAWKEFPSRDLVVLHARRTPEPARAPAGRQDDLALPRSVHAGGCIEGLFRRFDEALASKGYLAIKLVTKPSAKAATARSDDPAPRAAQQPVAQEVHLPLRAGMVKRSVV